jgi:thiopeptide-type bacteriocin biosynthesis protein
MARPEVREALFVASPDLEASLPAWEADPEGERGQRVERALVRYFSRMAGRATPFGLFAGVSLGRVGERTELLLAGRERCERHTRLDMDYLFALTAALVREPELRASLRYTPNSSLYRAAGRLRYVQVRVKKERERSNHLVAVEETEYLAATLARAARGARPAELAAALTDEEITPEVAARYVERLIESQILVPELAPAVTGPEPVHPLVAQLGTHEAGRAAAAVLEEVRDELAALDASGLGASPHRYRAVASRIEALPAPVELPRLLQVDLVRPAPAATLGREVIDEIRRGVELLRRICPPEADLLLDRFREAFVERYDRREVPLLEALDEEIGVGFAAARSPAADPSPLLQGLPFGAGAGGTVGWEARHSFLLGRLARVLERGERVLELAPADLEKLSLSEPLPLPDSYAAVAALVGAPGGDFRVLLRGARGPSGARLLGRHCHADPALQAAVERHLRAEEALRPEALFAEIAHLPEGRVGNVLCRPVLREYEIPYLGRSGAPPERQIPLADLRVAVRGGRVVLRSARLDREVVPCLANAHRFTQGSLPAYRFLCSLQYQGVAGRLYWDWGPLAAAPFLPRVISGRLLFAAARWRLDHEELRRLALASGAEGYCAVQQLRAARCLPRWVALVEDDDTLSVDLDNALSVASFLHLVRRRSAALLTELYPGPEELAARGPEGSYVHELVVPFLRSPSKTEDEGRRTEGSRLPSSVLRPPSTNPERLKARTPERLNDRRSFPPGSEWLTVKLYTGETTRDAALRELVGPVAREALESGAAERWFFVRYSDPECHLRVRFQGDPRRLQAETLAALLPAATAWVEEGRLRRVQLDTYEREVERYGGPEGIRLAEQVFHWDSTAVLEILELLEPGDAGLDERWRLALRGIDQLLADLGLDLPARRSAMARQRESFGREFRAGGALRGAIGDRFRKERAALTALLDPANDAGSPLAPGLRILAERSRRVAPVAAKLRAAEQEGRLGREVAAIARSLVHMHVNRMLRSAPRAQELVLYDFLTRLYDAQLARHGNR